MTVAVDAVVYYRVSNPWVAVCNVANASSSTRFLAATTLRNFLGTKSLSEILTDREIISSDMQVDGIMQKRGFIMLNFIFIAQLCVSAILG